MTGRALWTAKSVAAATEGRASGRFSASGVSIDSRTIAAGELFVAVRGPNFDGHDFVAEAARRGAAAALVARPPSEAGLDLPLVQVGDTWEALTGLARAARWRARAEIIAVTGSVGKTGTKDAIGQGLRGQAPTFVSAGNLNNAWGLPLSLARLPAGARYGVFELGMNHAGELAPLSRLLRPAIAVITNIAAVHMANFASTFDIAEAKAEVFAGMQGGTAVLNRDNPYFPLLMAAAEATGIERIVSFGAHPEANVRLLECALEASGSQVSAAIDGGRVDYRLAVAGRHWVTNSLAVLGAVTAVGADVSAAAEALAELKAGAGRGRRYDIALPGGGITLIDESYNASPTAMRAAFETLASFEPAIGGRRVAVLGDMLELGPNSSTMHRALADTLRRCGIDIVFTAGPQMAHLRDALPRAMRGGHAAESQRLAPIVAAAVQPGDVVTVKGSRGSRMVRVVEALLRIDAAPPRAANDR